jgi:alkylation response protein AidB-like acyl-CoA dehydrogenase
VHIELSDAQRALRDELRAYFAQLMTPERRTALRHHDYVSGGHYRETIRQMGRDGWLGVGWPTEYGGKGYSALEQMIFVDEVWRADAPIPFVTLNTVGPTVMVHGTREQKDALLPRILTGDLHVAIGYSEPGAGTDLASLTTRAVRDGDELVISGQKIWTSGANAADLIWLACRTDPDAPRHKGLSIVLVPTDSPGLSVSPIWTVGGQRTNACYFDEVRVPVANVVGGLNEGWKLITGQLNHERVGLAPLAWLDGPAERVVEWAATTVVDGRPLIDEPWVRQSLARVRAKGDVLRLMNWKVAWGLTNGQLNPADASSMKVFGTEATIDSLRLLMEIVGQVSYLAPDEPGAVLLGELDQRYRTAVIQTFGGGVNEVQREIVSMVGLSMPRAPR